LFTTFETFLLILSESCGRSGAVANIKWKDVQAEIYSDELPMKIWLVQKVKLSRKKYFTFICEDAKESLKLLIEKRNMKPNDKIFLTGYPAIRKRVMDVAERIGIYQNSNGGQAFRLHTYRKRGETMLGDAGVPLNWVDRILGHVPRGAQGKTYSLPPVERMREKYALGMTELEIYSHVQAGNFNGDVVTKTELCALLVQLFPGKKEEIKQLVACVFLFLFCFTRVGGIERVNTEYNLLRKGGRLIMKGCVDFSSARWFVPKFLRCTQICQMACYAW